MSGRIPQQFISDLVARTDIVELIGARVALKKAGREYRACCPFHNEKTPSFWVSPVKQFYHCFGCGAHGTAIGFLMAYDQLSFPEAVEELAQRLGLEVPREAGPGGDGGRGAPSHDGLYTVMQDAAKFYGEQLARSERAREYATRRGLDAKSIENFAIGYAPDSWNALLNALGRNEERRRAMAEAGLLVERDAGVGARGGDRHYDRFRDRLMFPIRDARGRVIAFGGRILDQGEPKYLNSPESPLFHKGRELYGLYEVRRSRTPLTRLLVVEGYMDVVRLHQAGIAYAVATLGTATTPEHLKRVFRLVSEVVFAFDGDRAGRAAAWRALNNVLPEARDGREIRFLFLPEGEDPDSLVGREGREAFEARLAGASPLSEYLIDALAGDNDLSHADGRASFAAAARPLIARLPEGVYRELLLGRVASLVGLPVERLRDLWRGDLPAGSTTGPGSGPAGGGTTREGPTGRGAADGTPRAARRDGGSASAGRGGLIRQIALLLVHFPASAAALAAEQVEGLATLALPGAPLLHELLVDLRHAPCVNTAQLLTRWQERPEGERLARLARTDMLIEEPQAAIAELRRAVERLLLEADRQRLDELVSRERERALTREEKEEIHRLIVKLGGRDAAS